MKTDETSVPIVSVPCVTIRPPTHSTEAIAIEPSISIPGKKSELRYCACVFVLPVRVVRRVELGQERPLAVERLDHGHAGDRLRDLRRHRRDRLAHAQERGVRANLEPAREDERRRQDHERDEPEPPVEHEQPDDRREERQRVDDERRQALREHIRQRVDVRGQARDDPARLLLREVAQRQRRQVVEEVAAQPEHDALADAGEAAHERRLQHPGERVDREVDDHVARQAATCRGPSCPCRSRPARSGARVTGAAAEQTPTSASSATRRAVADEVAAEARQAGALRLRCGTDFLSEERRRRRRPAASSSSGVPDSTTTPSSSTTARSATSTVESRCVAISTVRPASAGRRFSTRWRSVSRVDGRHRVVEHDDACARDERARERDALALAAGEVDAALADQRVVAVGELGGELRDAGRLAGGDDLLPRRVRAGPRSGSRAAGSRRGSASASRSRPRRAAPRSGTSRTSTPPTSTRPSVGS